MLAKTRHRLLLFDHNTKKLLGLVDEIRSTEPSADIEFMSCESEASWEADIIIPTVAHGQEKELAQKIKQFSNRKIVLNISDGSHPQELQKFLPGTSVINIANPFYANEEAEKDHIELFIGGDDDEALATTSQIMQAAGFVPVRITQFNNEKIYQSKINTMETTKWALDPTHSEIHFKVKHLMVSWISGSFKQFDATVETEGDDISTAKVRFTANIDSISTNNEQRDAHLRTGDFFDAENHPKLVFESDRLEKIDDENYKLFGRLSLRGNEKKVALNVEFGGITQDPWGNTRTGFSVTGKINRKDFGVSFSMVSETGGILLGEDVSISANVEFVKQTALQTKAA
jgi:polyisoprenoid-binding protein YceI